MTCLYIVPSYYLRNFRRSVSQADSSAQVTTMPGLVAQILKEGLVSYKEDRVLEEVAIWQSVQMHAADLHYFAPISHYPGFKQELKSLFRQMDLGEELFSAMPQEGRDELVMLHGAYQEILAEKGILSAPGQIRRSLELIKQTPVLVGVEKIIIQGLTELSPLEQELIHSLAQGRQLEILWPEIPATSIAVQKAKDPVGEVEMIGQALRRDMESGLSLDQLGVAFPNLAQYLPILIPVFAKLRIPWRTPEVSLGNTPLGKTLLTLVSAELQGWQKHHLELLTAPGWGFPSGLTAEEHRLLRLAPPLKGLPAWREYLGSHPGWEALLAIITEATSELVTQPLAAYGAWLEAFLAELPPERWVLPEDDLENWAELMKAWDGMQTLASGLRDFQWSISPEQFVKLLGSLLGNYKIQGRRVFAERVQVMGVEQIGAYTYEHLYVGGLVEGQFPPHKGAHWLTKIRPNVVAAQLYERLQIGTKHLHLFYPEVDREGKLNLPATILPRVEGETRSLSPEGEHQPSLFFGRGFLRDEQLLHQWRQRVLKEGLTVSQLNRYANCPYQFFCSSVLGVADDEEVSLELDARDHGNCIHQALQGFWEEHLEGALPTIEDGQAKMEGLLRREYAKIGAQPSKALLRDLRNFIRHDLNLAQGGFRPKYLEKWFQGLVIETSFGPVSLRGRIDRIDINADGAYVLYDYKTGTAPQIKAMLEGKDVQIAVYLLAAHNILPQGTNVGAAYYVIGDRSRKGIFQVDYAKALAITRGKNVLDEAGFQEQQETFSQILQTQIQRILAGEFPIEPASSRVCRFCPFQGICRKEVGS